MSTIATSTWTSTGCAGSSRRRRTWPLSCSIGSMRISPPTSSTRCAFAKRKRTGPSGDVTEANPPLAGRYAPGDLSVFTGPERDRFLGPHGVDGMKALHGDEDAWQRIEPHLVWEVLY